MQDLSYIASSTAAVKLVLFRPHGCYISTHCSTANIVPLGMLEKHYRLHINLFEWFKAGAVVGLVSCVIAWAGISLLSPHMPTKAAQIQARATFFQGAPAVEAPPTGPDAPPETVHDSR